MRPYKELHMHPAYVKYCLYHTFTVQRLDAFVNVLVRCADSARDVMRRTACLHAACCVALRFACIRMRATLLPHAQLSELACALIA